METHGIKRFEHIIITELGFKKGQTQVNEDNINKVFNYAREKYKRIEIEK